MNTWCCNNVVITSKRRHFDIITSKWWRHYCEACLLGYPNLFTWNKTSKDPDEEYNTFENINTKMFQITIYEFPFSSELYQSWKKGKISLVAVCNVGTLDSVKYIAFNHCGLVTPYGDINLGKLLFRCLTALNHYLHGHWIISEAFSWGRFHRKCSRYLSLIRVWKLLHLRWANKLMQCPSNEYHNDSKNVPNNEHIFRNTLRTLFFRVRCIWDRFALT